MGVRNGVPGPPVSQRPANGMGEIATHAARAAVRGAVTGYDHPALARSGGWHGLLHLFADRSGSFGADKQWICAIWGEYDWLAELHSSRASSSTPVCAGAESFAQRRELTSFA